MAFHRRPGLPLQRSYLLSAHQPWRMVAAEELSRVALVHWKAGEVREPGTQIILFLEQAHLDARLLEPRHSAQCSLPLAFHTGLVFYAPCPGEYVSWFPCSSLYTCVLSLEGQQEQEQ